MGAGDHRRKTGGKRGGIIIVFVKNVVDMRSWGAELGGGAAAEKEVEK